MNVLILGNSEDDHAAHLKNALTQAGATVDYLDTRLFPTQLRMTWQPNAQVGCLTLPGGRKLNLRDIHSVFWRSLSGAYVPSLEDTNQQRIAYNDSMSTLRSRFTSLPLSLAPVTIQEYVPGTNIRSYVIGGSVYSAEIRSKSLDLREDLQAELIPVELPESVQQQCLAITKALMLEWTAIDWRLKPTGEYVFLEANPSPMFLHEEHQTGFPITQELVRLLVN